MVDEDDQQLIVLKDEYIKRYKGVNSYLAHNGMISLRCNGLKMIIGTEVRAGLQELQI